MFSRLTKTTLPGQIIGNGLIEMFLIEIGPQHRGEIQFCISGASGIKLIEDSSIRELIKSRGKDPDLISVKEYLELAKAITNQEKQEVLIQVDEKSFVYLKY